MASCSPSSGCGGVGGVHPRERRTTTGADWLATNAQRGRGAGDLATGGDGGGAGAECFGCAVRHRGVRAVQPSGGAAVHIGSASQRSATPDRTADQRHRPVDHYRAVYVYADRWLGAVQHVPHQRGQDRIRLVVLDTSAGGGLDESRAERAAHRSGRGGAGHVQSAGRSPGGACDARARHGREL